MGTSRKVLVLLAVHLTSAAFIVVLLLGAWKLFGLPTCECDLLLDQSSTLAPALLSFLLTGTVVVTLSSLGWKVFRLLGASGRGIHENHGSE